LARVSQASLSLLPLLRQAITFAPLVTRTKSERFRRYSLMTVRPPLWTPVT